MAANMDRKTESHSEPMPQAVQRSLETALARIWNETAARELWTKQFTAADRRKFDEPWPAVWKKHNIIGMWHIARGTPTWNECIVEVAHALGFVNGPRRESLLEALGADTHSGKAPGARARSTAPKPHWDDEARELRYLGQLVRVVKMPKQAHNIVTILRTFQAAGWPARIDDPFKRQSSDQTRRSDVENLKKLLLKPLLTFACDGNGTGFLWKKVEKPKAKKASKRRRR
jgi:hypothetical protein